MWKLAAEHTLSKDIILQIKTWEGYRDKAYLDAASPPIWTIGYGHTDKVQKGWTCTQVQAEKWLMDDLKYAENVVQSRVKVVITQGMYDALVSFTYNCGAGKKGVKDGLVMLKNGNQSTLLKSVNNHLYEKAADEFPKWINAGSAKPRGLVLRRKIERDFFLKDGVELKNVEPPSIVLPIVETKTGFWNWIKSRLGVKP